MKIKIPIISPLISYSLLFWKIARFRFPLYILLSLIQSTLECCSFMLLIPMLSQLDITRAEDSRLTEFFNGMFLFLGIEGTFNNILILIAIALLLAGIAKFLQNILRILITTFIDRKLCMSLIDSYGKADYLSFMRYSTGYYNNLVVMETGRAVGAFGQYCLLAASGIRAGIYMTLAFVWSWEITLFSFICVSLITLLLKNIFYLTKKYSIQISEQNAALQENLIQTLQSYKYLKATNNYEKLKRMISGIVNRRVNVYRKEGLVNHAYGTITELTAPYLALLMVFYLVSLKGRNIADVIILGIFFYRAFTAANSLPSAWRHFLSSVGGLKTVEDASKRIMDNLEETGRTQIKSLNALLEIRNLYFFYGRKPVLKNITLSIAKNNMIAIVGESGVGKSTLADIITGVIKPTRGDIFIDGVNYSKIDIASLRSLIGYVTQEIIIFNDTVENNISLWSAEDVFKIKSAAGNSHSEEFIMELQEKYKTHIGDRGTKLSVGQRQRLAIARELFKEPEILIFDEATSALDSKSELFIQQSIDSLKHNKTIIIIAHRLSTIKNCDRVCVLDKGELVETGTFPELYNNKNSIFRKMCDMQKL